MFYCACDFVLIPHLHIEGVLFKGTCLKRTGGRGTAEGERSRMLQDRIWGSCICPPGLNWQKDFLEYTWWTQDAFIVSNNGFSVAFSQFQSMPYSTSFCSHSFCWTQKEQFWRNDVFHIVTWGFYAPKKITFHSKPLKNLLCSTEETHTGLERRGWRDDDRVLKLSQWSQPIFLCMTSLREKNVGQNLMFSQELTGLWK